MSLIFGIEVALVLITAVTIVFFLVSRALDKKKKAPKQFEPDLKLVDQPELISKVPENDTFIPDSNAVEARSNEARKNRI